MVTSLDLAAAPDEAAQDGTAPDGAAAPDREADEGAST
jgi:hypothetical protein